MIRDMLRQKGAVLALTALALPILVCVTGLAVDFGNIYFQRSRLQNAADAAAIAGAHTYANKAEKVNSHPNADTMAGQYLTGSAKNLEADEVVHPNFQAQSKDNITYYRVALKKDVPLYFLKAFYGKDTFTVPVESIASITPITSNDATKGPFQHLLIFEKNLTEVNSIENPDNLDKKEQILSSFDGGIIYTNGDGTNTPNYKYENLQYSTQKQDLKYFFTQKAINEKLSVNESIKKGTAQYDDNTGQTITDGYSYSAKYRPYDLSTFGKFIEGLPKQTQSGQNLSNTNISSTNNSVLYFDNISSFNIDAEIPGDINSPVYVYMGTNARTVNVHVNANSRRPVVIYAEGNDTTISIDYSGPYTLRGIMYAPNKGTVAINANKGTFSGTIAATNISLRGGIGHYRYENFSGISGGSGGSGGGSTSVSPTITLTNNPSGITWAD